MEIVLQDANETPALEAELSSVEQFRLHWRQQPGAIPLLKQKSMIDQHADLLPYAAVVSPRGWSSPVVFAAQGLLVAAALFSLFNWYLTRDSGRLQDEIAALQANVAAEEKRQQGVMDAAQAETKRIDTSPRSIVWKTVPREQALSELESSQADARKSLQEYKQRMAARETDLRSQQRAEALANSGTPLIFSLALVLAAGLVTSGVRRDFPR